MAGNFPLHMQNSFGSSSQGPSPASHLDDLPAPSSHLSTSQPSPIGMSGQSIISPHSNSSVIQSSGMLRQFHPSSHTHSAFSQNPGIDGSVSSAPFTGSQSHSMFPSSSSPLSTGITSPVNVPTVTPPPSQPTPPPASVPTSTRKAPHQAASISSGNSSSRGGDHFQPVSSHPPLLSKEKIEHLARTVDPNLKLDDDVQDFLAQYAGELVDELAVMSAKIAAARKSRTLEVQDVRFYLEQNWNIYIPGFGADPIKAKRKLQETEAHKNRQSIIKKHLKKF